MKRVLFQGERGCFSEAAAYKYFNERIDGKGFFTFEEVFQALKDDPKAYGVLPIENSLVGSIRRNYDLILDYGLAIVGEVSLKITYNLLANPGVPMSSVKEIWSHPVALEQCRNFLAAHPEFDVRPVYDTAGAAKKVKEEGQQCVGAISGPRATEIYGLDVLESKIEDHAENYTRFYVLSTKEEIATGENVKSSLVFGINDSPGILFKCLSVFALRNINLAKLESRPNLNSGKPWQYLFYIDFYGSIEDEKCSSAVENLQEVVSYLQFLGSYHVK
jgi:prephenate dehydratase